MHSFKTGRKRATLTDVEVDEPMTTPIVLM